MKAYIVDRTALIKNIRLLQERAAGVPMYGVVKGGGYGLGTVSMAEVLRECGIDRFAVTEISEVRALRESGFVQEEILMMRATCLPEELLELNELGAVITIGDSRCAFVADEIAGITGTPFRCHLKIDTGMGRYGFHPGDEDSMAAVYEKEHLQICGIYTHFHSAFCNDAVTKAQFSAFTGVCEALTAKGLQIGTRHCCNSSAFVNYPEMHLDAVRIGSALLGRLSFPDGLGLTKIGWCEAQVEVLREIPRGHSVGYGAAWTAKRPTRIAVCGVGNGHGFGAEKGNDIFRFRDCVRGGLSYVKAFLKHKAFYVTVNGTPARVLGHIGMVQTTCDVTDIPCEIGDPIRIEINPLMVKGLDVVFRD